MAAVIGALRVDLGLNSAEFSAGLKKASVGLGNFAKTAGIGLAAVATAATAAGVALGIAVKGAINNADQMGEMAQQVGVSVEALTSLGYAAKMSGSDTETLATGLRKLSQNMLVLAQGSAGPAATAFSALGISVQNANGSLRDSDAVLIDVADRFSRMEDGATKTALAVQLFGRSGAELIPFLNQGRDGIRSLTTEADRLGVTISGATANAAGQFNDTLDRLQATFQGVINKIMEGALPSLNQLASKLADPSFAAAAQALAQGVVGAINLIVDAISTAGQKLREFGQLLDWMSSRDWATGELDPNKVDARRRGAMAELSGQLGRGESEAPGSDFYTGIFGAPAASVAATNQQLAASFAPVITNTKAASAAASELNSIMSEGKAVFAATRTPAEAYSLEVERLNALLQKGAIDQDTYNRAVLQAQDAFDTASQAGSEMATTLSDGLVSIFGAVIDGSGNAISAVEDLIKALAKMAITKGIEMLFGAAFGGGFSSSITGSRGGFFPGISGPRLPSFDGGGYTGGGSRSGGLDGKGGFLSMLHPDETVLDHSKGQGMGGLTVHIDARGAQMGVAEQIDQWARFQLPSLVNKINYDPLARG